MEDNGSICLVTLDGTDFRIYEQTPFDPKWKSHKFNGPGVRYEVGVCMQTGWIVWINGPYPAGRWTDLNICRDAICCELDADEKFLADGVCSGAHGHSEMPNGLNNDEQCMKAVARARHENVNRLFKHCGILERTSGTEWSCMAWFFLQLQALSRPQSCLSSPC